MLLFNKMEYKLIMGGILILASFSRAQEWKEPYFIDAETEGVTFDKQIIKMEEELNVPIKLAIINYYGRETPEIGDFDLGKLSLLGATIEEVDDDWCVMINAKQDFENSNQRKYQFEVKIGTTKSKISLLLTNIFDEDPTINYDGPCRAKELESNLNTDCTFTIYDPDGLESNKFRFEIEGQNNDSQLFEFRYMTQVDPYTAKYALYVIKDLHYEHRALYNFRTTVYDIANNNNSIMTIVEVIDMPNLDPVWVQPFATATFPEKHNKTFVVQAMDGDTGINKQIWYRLGFPKDSLVKDLIEIEKQSGILKIDEIDRDELKQETFSFTIYAYKFDNETWAISSTAVIIITDINDNFPEITLQPETIKFKETTYLTLELSKFIVNDIDLGDNANYIVSLDGEEDIKYSRAFEIIPNTGYQKANFKITVSNASLLDYEEPKWQTFDLTITAYETSSVERKRQKILHIELINRNDEIPIFVETEYTVKHPETMEANSEISKVLAEDRDIGDKIVYEIVGLVPGIVISEDGVLSTIADDVFDYERQQEVMIQIKATDTLPMDDGAPQNTAYAQLKIIVTDVNDETPEIRMPRATPNITENSKGNTIVTELILATDKDTTAELRFEIDWDNSYATKSGQDANIASYKDCFVIEKVEKTRNEVYGHLKVNPDFELDIDYEEYEVIYLVIRVTDDNQEVKEGSAEGVLTVRIIDENDNAPEFMDSEETDRSVVELAKIDTVVGTILAKDIDGPGNNIVKYSMSPKNDETPDGLISIDPKTGELKVAKDEVIDCDNPKIYYFEYKVEATDGKHSTYTEVKIRIIDINDEFPQVVQPADVELYENITNDDIIGTITATDNDRDKPYNIMHFSINYDQFPDLANFQINGTTGLVTAKLYGNSVFDRDKGPEYEKYDIYIIVEDNYLGNGRPNANKTKLTLILLDVNDNAPEMMDPANYKPQIEENFKKDMPIGPVFIAEDKDEKFTPNSLVSYKILDIQPGWNHPDPIPSSEDLFRIETEEEEEDTRHGQLYSNKDMKGFYGTWKVTIEAYDHGNEWTSGYSQSSSETYNITVLPYNFNAPKIIFPNEKSIRLRSDGQKIGSPLILIDKSQMPPFQGEDPDGAELGDIWFNISSPGSRDVEYFGIEKDTRTESVLVLKKQIQPKYYELNIIAKDGGSKQSQEITNFRLVFVDMEGEPIFEDMTELQTNFTENEIGLTEERLMPEARDPKNVDLVSDLYPVYYFIYEKYRPDDAKMFNLDSKTRILQVKFELDRENIDRYEIKIIATNEKELPVNPNENLMLTVEITVNDLNDNPPKFINETFGGGITTNDYVGRPILIVKATDPDLNDRITYEMDMDTLTASNNGIENIKKNLFALDQNTGDIKLQNVPGTNMKGFFQFNVTAYDLERHSDTCMVKIYIVAEGNRVSYVFLNTKDFVEENRAHVITTLREIYGYDSCNIDEISEDNPDTRNGRAENQTEAQSVKVRVHFIHNNEPIEATVIQARSNDAAFLRKLKTSLNVWTLWLDDIPTASAQENVENGELLTTVLEVVSAVLGTLCLVLIIAFFVRTRNLNRQLKAFSATDFGSTESNLNRRGAPTTNVFSVEGANPVLNDNELTRDAFDNSSYDSDESDFVGINDDPNFMYDDDRKDSKNSSLVEQLEQNYIKSLNNTKDDIDFLKY